MAQASSTFRRCTLDCPRADVFERRRRRNAAPVCCQRSSRGRSKSPRSQARTSPILPRGQASGEKAAVLPPAHHLPSCPSEGSEAYVLALQRQDRAWELTQRPPTRKQPVTISTEGHGEQHRAPTKDIRRVKGRQDGEPRQEVAGPYNSWDQKKVRRGSGGAPPGSALQGKKGAHFRKVARAEQARRTRTARRCKMACAAFNIGDCTRLEEARPMRAGSSSKDRTAPNASQERSNHLRSQAAEPHGPEKPQSKAKDRARPTTCWPQVDGSYHGTKKLGPCTSKCTRATSAKSRAHTKKERQPLAQSRCPRQHG